eukprot:TRINITY_DN48049_c0_g1_i2.p1 TRINITY_DN48049_c0_g1~~TRINITY_DN48049_c0_g1_i2.p1  ORF type:complete len:195 (+),score=1.39 TRINITY_DN48049_c0_g1_i2:24-608(+)
MCKRVTFDNKPASAVTVQANGRDFYRRKTRMKTSIGRVPCVPLKLTFRDVADSNEGSIFVCEAERETYDKALDEPSVKWTSYNTQILTCHEPVLRLDKKNKWMLSENKHYPGQFFSPVDSVLQCIVRPGPDRTQSLCKLTQTDMTQIFMMLENIVGEVDALAEVWSWVSTMVYPTLEILVGTNVQQYLLSFFFF